MVMEFTAVMVLVRSSRENQGYGFYSLWRIFSSYFDFWDKIFLFFIAKIRIWNIRNLRDECISKWK